MGADAVCRLIFACLALYWDLTGDVCSQIEPECPEYAATHGAVFPYSMRFRQQVLDQIKIEQSISPGLELSATGSLSPTLEWQDVTSPGWGPAPTELLYCLMSLQR